MAKRNVLFDVLRQTWPVILTYIAVGTPCGIMGAKAGLTPWMNFLLGFNLLSGGGQFAAFNLWIAGVPMPSLLASVGAISARFALYSASLAPYLKGFSKAQTLLIATSFTEESYGINLSKLIDLQNGTTKQDANNNPEWSPAHACVFNLVLQITWALSCFAGGALGNAVNIPTAIASFTNTALFIYLLYVQEHNIGNAVAVISAVLVVVLCKWSGFSSVAVPVAAVAGVLIAVATSEMRRSA